VLIPAWGKAALDQWTTTAAVAEGKIFRAVATTGKVWGIWHLTERGVVCRGTNWLAFPTSQLSRLARRNWSPLGVQQKLMRPSNISTTMNVYGGAFMEAKRKANTSVVQRLLSQNQST
jgi:hypothetical protein